MNTSNSTTKTAPKSKDGMNIKQSETDENQKLNTKSKDKSQQNIIF